MSSLQLAARRTSAQSLSRAPSSLLTNTHGRSPAYRRLLTQSSLSRSVADDARPASSSSATATLFLVARNPAALPPPFLPSTIQLAQSRAFHMSALRLQQKPQQQQQQQQQQAQQQSGKKPETEGAKAEAAGGEGAEKEKSSDGGEEQKASSEEEGGEKKDGKEEEKKKEEDLPPPPPHGDKTPWQVFMDTMQSEFKQSKEWNESTKALAEGAHQFTESESVQRARKAYEATSGAVSSTATNVLKTTATAVGKGASWTWETPVMKGVRKGANATGEVLDKATKPIRETEAFKNVKDVIDDGSSSRYGGWVEKEERRRRREKWRELQGHSGAPEVFQENPTAGTNVTVHKDAAWKEAWRDFKDTSKVMQGYFNMRSVYNESENPLISTARSITDRVAGFFAENETAMVIKKLRAMDPSFQLEPFLRELREYILPEVLDAYVKGDVETLKLWLSEAQFSVYEALTKQYLQAGLKSDGRILDIRHVDILKARMLEPGEIPVFIITCRTQEVHVYRKVKTGELAAGMEDKVQLVTYAIGITRVPEDVNNAETRGWRLIEMQKSGRDYI